MLREPSREALALLRAYETCLAEVEHARRENDARRDADSERAYRRALAHARDLGMLVTRVYSAA